MLEWLIAKYNTLSTGALCKVDLKKDLLKKLPSPSPSPAKVDLSPDSSTTSLVNGIRFLTATYFIGVVGGRGLVCLATLHCLYSPQIT